MICLGCVAGVRLSPIQFVGAMDDVYLFLQSHGSRFPRGFRAIVNPCQLPRLPLTAPFAAAYSLMQQKTVTQSGRGRRRVKEWAKVYRRQLGRSVGHPTYLEDRYSRRPRSRGLVDAATYSLPVTREYMRSVLDVYVDFFGYLHWRSHGLLCRAELECALLLRPDSKF